MIKKFSCMLKLVITERTNCSFDDIERIGDNVSIEFIFSLGVNQRFVISGQASQSRLHLIDELLQSRVEVERLVVDKAVDLTDPLHQSVDPSNAVVPPGDPLVEENNNMNRIALSRN